MNQENERIVLEPTGNFDEIDDLNKTIIPTANLSEVVYLGDITDIYKEYASPRETIVRVNGQPTLSLAILLKKGANIVRLGEIIDEQIIELNGNLPIGVELMRLSSMDDFVDGEVNSFINNSCYAKCHSCQLNSCSNGPDRRSSFYHQSARPDKGFKGAAAVLGNRRRPFETL